MLIGNSVLILFFLKMNGIGNFQYDNNINT